MSSETIDTLTLNIYDLCKTMQSLTRRVELEYSAEVDALIQTNCRYFETNAVFIIYTNGKDKGRHTQKPGRKDVSQVGTEQPRKPLFEGRTEFTELMVAGMAVVSF